MITAESSIAARHEDNQNNRRLRVLFVSHAYVVGVNQGKLEAIAKTGKVDVGLLAPSNWKALEWNRVIPLEKPYSNIQIYEAPVSFTGRGGAHFYSPWKIWQVLNDFQPDVVQVEEEVFSLCTFEFALWSRLTGKPLAVFGWENMERHLPLVRRWICQFVLKTAKLLIPGNQDGESIMRSWGYQGLLEVMPQIGVDPNFFAARRREAALQKLHSDRAFCIGFLGRLAPGKGVDILFCAVRQLQERGLDCRLIICGSGASEEALRQEAHKQEVANLVTWRGGIRHHQAPEEISQFDVLVLPSRTVSDWKEQFGHVLIEAMVMGVPVVGSSSGEIPNLIGQADLVFPEEDAQGLAAILERMISQPQWWEEVGNYCLQRAYQCYTHERIAERLVNLWQKILPLKSEALMVNREDLT